MLQACTVYGLLIYGAIYFTIVQCQIPREDKQASYFQTFLYTGAFHKNVGEKGKKEREIEG